MKFISLVSLFLITSSLYGRKPVHDIIPAKKTERTRNITVEEYQFALSVFQREFPPRDEIFISDETGIGDAYFVRPTINGNIRICLGGMFDKTMDNETNKGIFLHELTHAWQIRHYGYLWYGAEAFCNQVINPDPYSIGVCNENKAFGDFNAEQQAELVRFYYAGKWDCATKITSKVFKSDSWRLLIGSDAHDITVDGNGNFYMTNTKGIIYRYYNQNWQYMPGSDGKSIAANGGKLIMTNTVGKIYKWANTKWVQMPGSDARDVAVEKNGTIWMVNTAGKIYKWVNTRWDQMPGSDASRIAAGDNNVWMINKVGKIYKWGDGKWTQQPGSDGRDIAVSNDGAVFLTNTDGEIYKLVNTKWEKTDGSDGSKVSANKNTLVLVNTGGRLYYKKY